jgi:rhamnulokinase
MPTPVVAVDFGASSIRVCRVDLDPPEPHVDIVHRYAHGPVTGRDGVLRWDWSRLVAETERGLDLALTRGPVASIGVDTWGVDYGLLDAHGDLVAPPVSYRDRRTDAYHAVVHRVGAERLYRISGLPPLAFNTIFQLAAEDPATSARARRALLLPELLVHHLTGEQVAERTSAGTTGLLDLATGDWSAELLDTIGVARSLLAPIAEPGTRVGTWRGVPVHLVAGHDTASAVLGGGLPRHGFVSAGTWLIVGREAPTPDTSVAARRAGIANEQAAGGGIRRLRNVAGWWLVDECRRRWGDPALTELLEAAAGVDGDVPVVDATDARFLAPSDMAAELRAAAGLPDADDHAALVRCAVESMAAGAAAVLDAVDDDPAEPLAGVRVFGGGAQSRLLVDALARRTGRPVSVGPVEATALGNAAVQGRALGG